MKRIVPVIIATVLVLAITPVPAFVLSANANSALPAIRSARHRNTEISKHYVEVQPGIWMAVKGARERRQVRFARLIEIWSDDQQAVARENGFPVFRYRELDSGRTSEIWSYPEDDMQFIFDVPSGRLLEKRVG